MWRHNKTTKTRTKTTYQAGDQVIVTLENDAEGDEQRTLELTWTYDEEQTSLQFLVMVRNEVRAHLKHLNRELKRIDVTEVYKPTKR